MKNKNKIGQFLEKDFAELKKQLERLRQMIGGNPEPAIEEIEDDFEYDEDAEFNEGTESDPSAPFAFPLTSNPSGPSNPPLAVSGRAFNGSGYYYTPMFTGLAYGLAYGVTGNERLQHIINTTPILDMNIYVDPKYKKAPVYAKKHHPLTNIFADKKND